MRKNNKNSLCKRQWLGIFGIMVVCSSLLLSAGVFAEQEGPPAPVTPSVAPFDDVGAGTSRVSNFVVGNIWSGIAQGGTAAMLGFLQYMTQKLAYDTATSISTGSFHIFDPRNWDNIAKDYANDATSKALDELSRNTLGFGICEPPNLSANLNLLLGLQKAGKPELKCKFDLFAKGGPSAGNVGRSWQQWYAVNKPKCDREPGGAAACRGPFFEALLDPNTTEAGIAADAAITIGSLRLSTEKFNLLQAIENKSINAKKHPVTGQTLTPQQIFVKDIENLSPSEREKGASANIRSVLSTGKVWTALFAGMTSTFMSVFVNNLAQSAIKGIFPAEKTGSDRGGQLAGDGGPLYEPDSTAALRTSKPNPLLLPKPIVRNIDDFDIVRLYMNCSAENQSGITPHPDECVVDTALGESLVTIAKTTPFTVRQAIEGGGPLQAGTGILHGEWQLWGPDHPLNGTIGCRKTAYCYDNLVKLRKARIIPLGWEIAAWRSTRSPNGPWTLLEVMEKFNNYNEDGTCADSEKRCGLIDPNWVMKAPPSACGMFGPGAVLAKGGASIRHEACSDLRSCLAEEGGTCVGGFGYCTQERKTWRLDATTCDAQYNTCQSFAQLVNGQQGPEVGLLTRSLDYSICSADNVGCRELRTFKQNGAWVATDGNGINTRLFLNSQAQTCESGSAGCTRMLVPGTTDQSVNLKIAPPYLNCYTGNGESIDYGTMPQNRGQLNAVLTSAGRPDECKNYAGVCIPEEVGCNLYTPTSFAGPAVPAVGKEQDRCSQECVGYDAYKQLATPFEEEKPLVHFIPSTAQVCPVSEVGCDQYVNIDAAERGGEALAYFKRIQSCLRPEDTPAGGRGVYYSWVGSDAKGYELISFSLLQTDRWLYEADPAAPATTGGFKVTRMSPSGSGSGNFGPDYAESYSDDVLIDYLGRCNKTLYEARSQDPDCRELFDDAGNRFYRLLSHTVEVSEACAPFRKTAPSTYEVPGLGVTECTDAGGEVIDDNACRVCRGGGRLQEGQCIYWVLEEKSVPCDSVNSGCRQYSGNFANNVEEIYSGNFEDTTNGQQVPAKVVDGQKVCDKHGVYDSAVDACFIWRGTQASNESTAFGGHSLHINDNSALYLRPTLGGQYEVRFWARGANSVGVGGGAAQAKTPLEFIYTDPSNQARTVHIDIGSQWNQYKVALEVKAREDNDDAFVLLGLPVSGSVVFIDNVQIVRIQNTLSFVKNSWTTPLTCDPTPDDQFPGPQLGCQRYRDQNGITDTFKSFGQLCRQEAVGCRELVNTFNSTETGAVTYNAVCGTGGSAGPDEVVENVPGQPFGTRTCYYKKNRNGPSCTIPAGPTNLTCLLKVDEPVPAGDTSHHGSSTVVVPADKNMFIVDKPASRCEEQFIGCTAVGRVDHSEAGGVAFTDAHYINNPGSALKPYSSILCSQAAEGCAAYDRTGVAGGRAYFKDPTVLGRRVCEFKQGVSGPLDTDFSGWFIKGTNDPCYPEYIVPGNQYGLWSTSDQLFAGHAGLCPVEQAGCKQIIDHADTSQAANGRVYHIIEDERFVQSINSCLNDQGRQRVGLEEGCVLLDDTTNPAKYWSAQTTYAYHENAARQERFVAPRGADVAANNDANIIVKVQLDRECGEWLACGTSRPVYDSSLEKVKQMCSELILCSSSVMPDGSKSQNCTQTKVSDYNKPLTDVIYQDRERGWYAPDLSGYSFVGSEDDPATNRLAGKWQVGNIQFVSAGDSGGDERIVPVAVSDVNAARDACEDRGRAAGTGAYVDCVVNGIDGKCIAGLCVHPLEGSAFADDVGTQNSNSLSQPENFPQLACRLYPELQAPFKDTVVQEWSRVPTAAEIASANPAIKGPAINAIKRIPNFDQVRVCQEGYECECNYSQIDYNKGAVTRYYGTKISDKAPDSVPAGVCDGGTVTVNASTQYSKEGWPCGNRADCRDEVLSAAAKACRSNVECDTGLVCSGGQCASPGIGGNCLLRSNTINKLGVQGYCLEYDNSIVTRGAGPGAREQYCRTWLPLDYVPGTQDIFNQAHTAGFAIDQNLYYCLQTEGDALSNDDILNRVIAGVDCRARSDDLQGLVAPVRIGPPDNNPPPPSDRPEPPQANGLYLSPSLYHPEADWRTAGATAYEACYSSGGQASFGGKVESWFLGPAQKLQTAFGAKDRGELLSNRDSSTATAGITHDRGVEAFGACVAAKKELADYQHDYNNPGREDDLGRVSTVRFREIKRDEIDKLLVVFNWNWIPEDTAMLNALNTYSKVYGATNLGVGSINQDRQYWDVLSKNSAGEVIASTAEPADEGYWCKALLTPEDRALPQFTRSNLYEHSDFPHPFSGIWLIPGQVRLFGGPNKLVTKEPHAYPDGHQVGTGQLPHDLDTNFYPAGAIEEQNTLLEGNNYLKFETFGKPGVGSQADDVNMNNKFEKKVSGGKTVPDDPLYGFQSFNANEHFNDDYQFLSEAVGDTWHVRYRSDIDGNDNFECNHVDFFTQNGPNARNNLYTAYGGSTGDGIIGDSACLQMKFWFDNDGILMMDWDAVSGGDDGGSQQAIAFKVYAYLKDQCVAIAQTYDAQEPGSAKPWTNKLWDSATKEASQTLARLGSPDAPPASGSFVGPEIGLKEGVGVFAKDFYGAAPSTVSPGSEKWYTVFDPFSPVNSAGAGLPEEQRAGLPYSSATYDVYLTTHFSDELKTGADRKNFVEDHAAENDPGNKKLPDGSITDGVRALNRVFAKILRLWVWDKGEGGYREYSQRGDINPDNVDINKSAGGEVEDALSAFSGRNQESWLSSLIATGNKLGNAPYIQSFDPITCKQGRGKDNFPTNKCTPKNRNAFNVSGKDGVPPDDGIVFGLGSKEVDLQFYAGAHANQLPLKRLSIAWGDGADPEKANVVIEGSFKNHKAYCAPDAATPVSICTGLPQNGVTCAQNSECSVADRNGSVRKTCQAQVITEKGNIPLSCEENTFSFTHRYSFGNCPGSNVQTVNYNRADHAVLRRYNMRSNQRFCEFKPRVMVTDQWGMCNGTCGQGSNNAQGCYDERCNFSEPNAGTTFWGRVIISEP